MGGAYNAYGERRGMHRVLMRKPEEKDHLVDPGVEGKLILGWIFRKWDGGMDWIDLAQDRNRWRDLVKAVIYLRVPYNEKNFVTS
jgi:hypothetical protein